MNLADTPTPKAQAGTWTLTAPDGRTWTAESPLKCVAVELRERVPADVALARIERECSQLETTAAQVARDIIASQVPMGGPRPGFDDYEPALNTGTEQEKQ